MNQKKLPIGIENFEEIRREGFYYIDKTGLIRDLLNNWGKVNLFTRPRRFGKTLNMSMLKCFLEIGADQTLFDGLSISKDTELCEKYMGRFPVVFVSLKGVDGLTFQAAFDGLKNVIQAESVRIYSIVKDARLTSFDQEMFQHLMHRTASESEILNSLKFLSNMLFQCFGQKAILLIDEYDVPMDKAFHHGYYDEMTALIRSLFGQALKSNDFLYFAVLTGCLRVSKESIFAGLNNFKVLSITDPRFDEHFGFTDSEVRHLLEEYHFSDHYAETKTWYDGYRFGDIDVYCPWDVINHVDHLCGDSKAVPQTYWINTSGNDLVRRFIDKADKTTQNEIERLIAGEAITKKIRLELTYDEIDNSIDNLWSVLFTTGYLTQAGRTDYADYKLVIPNREVREVFVLQIQEWFKEQVKQNESSVLKFCRALITEDPNEIQKCLDHILGRTISILDTKARTEQKENFYHGLLLGLLRNESDWLILSNAESGDGFCDILIEPEEPDTGIIIEVKYAPTMSGLESACQKAIDQIRERHYQERLANDGRTNIKAYGIAFFKKRCYVMFEAPS